jgi:16S rRNA C1402 N4-methylase RsmH
LSTGGLKTGPAVPAAPAQRLEEMDVEAAFSHLPVMVREVVELFLPVPAGMIVDCTVGGGHRRALEARSDVRCSGSTVTPTPSRRRQRPPFGGAGAVVEGGFEQLADWSSATAGRTGHGFDGPG